MLGIRLPAALNAYDRDRRKQTLEGGSLLFREDDLYLLIVFTQGGQQSKHNMMGNVPSCWVLPLHAFVSEMLFQHAKLT